MSFKKEWLKPGLRVLTRDGPGALVRWDYPEICEVKLDKPLAGSAAKETITFEPGEIVVASDFTLIRAINCEGTLISNAQNYPSWQETLEVLSQPYSQDETLIGLNFQERILEANRSLPVWPYHLVQAYLDMYWPKMERQSAVYDTLEEAKKAWQKIDSLSGTTDHILLCALVNLQTSRILARAVFSTLKVISKEVWW